MAGARDTFTKVALTVLVSQLIFNGVVWADESDQWKVGGSSSSIAASSQDSKLDPRLPPVLPGERVNRNGHEMRVWSTSGPVPGAQESDANTRHRPHERIRNEELEDLSVIVDQRSGEHATSSADN